MFFVTYNNDDRRWYLHNVDELANGSFVPREWIGAYDKEHLSVRYLHLLNHFKVNPLTFDLHKARFIQRFEEVTGEPWF